ncbi:MAG TPA: zinc ribbon domain-containing protein [Gammaproteobacteria bacterium]
MPIYEYECKACGHRLETIQKISDAPLTLCPECNKPELKKLISASGFRLKGGGWYETDFKRNNKKNLVQSDASKDSKDSKSTEKADKPDKKSEKKSSETAGSKSSKKKSSDNAAS